MSSARVVRTRDEQRRHRDGGAHRVRHDFPFGRGCGTSSAHGEAVRVNSAM
ncbi:hypothetical protein I552_0112 [Mycobacterium xenopi 3993]|nr:hypothetical protein I552_0112 [Mycobacterium xenopi 3993]